MVLGAVAAGWAAVGAGGAALQGGAREGARAASAEVPVERVQHVGREGHAGQQGQAEQEGYVEREVRGFRVFVERDLAGAEVCGEVLELLEHRLFEVERVVPRAALERLRGVAFWLGLEQRPWSGVYHPSAAWLEENGHDPSWAKGIQFGVARDFLDWSRDQPAMVLHELAHAYHDQVLGKDHGPLIAAFEAARADGRYGQVLRSSGQREPAYAITNVDEYFAELSEAYFWVNDFYPFVRAELREHDPAGFAAVEAAWGL
jgi:hypothetical protein